MAPEQLAGEKDRIGPAADVWALSVLLHELVFDATPFPASSLIITTEALSPSPTRSRRSSMQSMRRASESFSPSTVGRACPAIR